MLKRPAAPAPLAITSGMTPSTMAAVVIRIGRKRVAAACSMASRLVLPARCSSLANSTISAVLGDQAHQGNQTDLGVDVERVDQRVEENTHADEAGQQVDEDHRAEHGHRHRHEDHDRIHAGYLNCAASTQVNDDHDNRVSRKPPDSSMN